MEDYVVIWEAKPLIKPEYRLYYDDKGYVLCYSCAKPGDPPDPPDGKFIIIDAATYAAGRPDVRVVEGKITTVNTSTVVSKLMPSIDGQSCPEEDISIVVDDAYQGNITKWNLTVYELR